MTYRISDRHCGTWTLVAACGIYFPDQGLNPGPLNWERSLSHWTTREVPPLVFLFVDLMRSGTGLGTATLRLSLWICKAALWRPCDHECVTDEVQPGERRPCEAQGGLCISSCQCSWSSCCWQFNRNSLSIITYLRSALSAMGMCLFTELMYKIDGSWSYLAAPWKWGKKPSLALNL